MFLAEWLLYKGTWYLQGSQRHPEREDVANGCFNGESTIWWTGYDGVDIILSIQLPESACFVHIAMVLGCPVPVVTDHSVTFLLEQSS
jgi:hypothetical protein